MGEKTITVVIDEQGNSSIDLEGFQGRGCADIAKDFQGSDAVKSARNKREFYAEVAAGKPQRQQA